MFSSYVSTIVSVNKMKRFLVVLALIATVLGVMLYFSPKPFENYIVRFHDCETFVYCRQTTLDATDMGNGYLVKCTSDALQKTLESCTQIDGISVRIAADEQEFVRLQQQLNLNVFFEQQLGDLQIVCGRSCRFSGGIWLDGKFVNVQMAFDGSTVTLGSPLILDSY